MPVVTLEIIPSGTNGWDLSKAKRLEFKNKKKAMYFSIYYTGKHDCLIRYYGLGIWLASYCRGKQIWNIY